jgi:hypothetical protein
VIAIGGIADTLRHQPESSAYLVRAALWGIAQEALVDYILDPQFPITELEALQKHFAASRWDDGYVRGLVGDRVLAYEMLGSPLRDVFDEGQLPGTELRQVLLQTQPRECGEALGMLSDIIDAARSSSDELHVTHQLVYDALHAKVESGATKLKSDEQQAVRHSNESLPFWVVETNPSFPARYLAQQRATVVMLAIERFRREQGKLPSTLGDLVPRYLDEVPGDPFDDQPLRFLRDGDRYTIYSVGTDLNDDLGALGYAGGRKDIGLSIPRLKK